MGSEDFTPEWLALPPDEKIGAMMANGLLGCGELETHFRIICEEIQSLRSSNPVAEIVAWLRGDGGKIPAPEIVSPSQRSLGDDHGAVGEAPRALRMEAAADQSGLLQAVSH